MKVLLNKPLDAIFFDGTNFDEIEKFVTKYLQEPTHSLLSIEESIMIFTAIDRYGRTYKFKVNKDTWLVEHHTLVNNLIRLTQEQFDTRFIRYEGSK